MKPEKVIAGKYILIVDDEKDVLDIIVELLDMCKLDTASTFDDAKKLLEENEYDIAVLDIMGVDGYELLKIANSRNIPAVMLTAHALSSDHLKRSAEEGAAYYAPKDKINDIALFLDRLSVHRSKVVQERMEELGIPCIFNAPYNCDAMPCENIFAYTKKSFRIRRKNI